MYYCINEIVQLFRLLTKKRNRKQTVSVFPVNTDFFWHAYVRKLYPIDTKLLPTGIFQDPACGRVTPLSIRKTKKGQPRHRAAQSEKFGLQDLSAKRRFFADPRVLVPGVGG